MACGKLGVHHGNPVTVIVTTALAGLDQAAHAVADKSVPMPVPARTGGRSRLPMADLIAIAAKAVRYLAVSTTIPERPLYLGHHARRHRRPEADLLRARPRLHPAQLPRARIPLRSTPSPNWARGSRTDADALTPGADTPAVPQAGGNYAPW